MPAASVRRATSTASYVNSPRPAPDWAGMQLNPVDLLLVAIVLVGAWAGWARGFAFAALAELT